MLPRPPRGLLAVVLLAAPGCVLPWAWESLTWDAGIAPDAAQGDAAWVRRDAGTLPDAARAPDGGSGADGAAPADAAPRPDAAADASSPRDAATPPDGSPPDATALAADGGAGADGAVPEDAGHPDAAAPVDGSVPGDAGVATDAAPVPDAADAATPDAATADAATADAATPDAATPDAATPDAATPDAGPRQRVRVMAANLTSGNYQTYNGTLQGGPAGIRIMQGLQPDVILVQEFNYDTNGDRTYEAFEIAAMVDLVCGSSCFYARGPGSSSGMIPNGVISRFPILASGEWDDPQISNREFFYAVIDLPGPRDLWAVSIHLSTDLTKRTRGGQALAQHLVDNVPDTYFLVVGGDLNTDTADEPAVQALDSRLETLVFPVDQAGVTGTSANRNKPYDRVMPDDTLEAYRVPVVVGSQVFPTGLVFDSRVYTPLSDVPPVQEGDSAQASMQHMAVIKDFLVPAGQP